MKNKLVTTRTAKIWMGDDGIKHVVTLPNADITLEDAKTNIKVGNKIHANTPCPLLVNLSQIKSITREARAYFANEKDVSTTTATALIVNSHVSKIIGNFYLNFNRPAIPTKLFTNQNEAIAWLKGFFE